MEQILEQPDEKVGDFVVSPGKTRLLGPPALHDTNEHLPPLLECASAGLACLAEDLPKTSALVKSCDDFEVSGPRASDDS
jgi:hypothetical protein